VRTRGSGEVIDSEFLLGDNWENKKAVATRLRDTFSLEMAGQATRHHLVQEMVGDLDLFFVSDI
jgi:hypothetical protein